MYLSYLVASPDVASDPSVTAFQGELAASFRRLAEIGYDAVEFMMTDPKMLDWAEIKSLSDSYGLPIKSVCTGEVYGQRGLSFTDPNEEKRKEAVERVKDIIDFASHFGALINIGRVRGTYHKGVAKEQIERWAIDAFCDISDYAKALNVQVVVEPVCILQTDFINTAQQASDIIDRVNRSNFRMMMDVFHMNIEEKSICESIKKYSKYNAHVHFSDNNRRYPGNCSMDYPSIIEEFKKAGYDGVFSVEAFQYPDQETAASETMEYLAPIFEKVYGRKRR